MRIEQLSIIMGLTGAGILGYAGYVVFRSKANKSQEASNVTRMDDQKVIHLCEIAKIWRNIPMPENKKEKELILIPVFRRAEISSFYANEIEKRPVINGQKKVLICKILTILDEQGECSSVVRKAEKESDCQYGDELFVKLATIPLWEHSLDVARAVMRRVTHQVMIPDVLIVALGHDLGKIQAYQNAYYRSGDHPILSIIALSAIPEFKEVKNREELSRIVRHHHISLPVEEPLLKILKEADAEARFDEIARVGGDPYAYQEKAEPKKNQPTTKKPDNKAGKSSPKVSPPLKCPAPLTSKDKGGEDPGVPSSNNSPSHCPSLAVSPPQTDAPSFWLDLSVLLNAIFQRINVLENGRWSAISSPQGLVYVNPHALWEEIERIAVSNPRVLAAASDEGLKRKLLHETVEALAKRGAVQSEGIRLDKGYYTTQAIVVIPSGKTIPMFLVPFYCEAFGVLISALEAGKPIGLHKMVKTIRSLQSRQEE
jgi:hypothetical protein